MRRLLVVLGVLALLVAACGDDDDNGDDAAEDTDGTEEAAAGDLDSFCSAMIDIETATAAPEADPTQVQAAAEAVQAVAPDEVRDAVDTAVELLPQLGEGEPPEEFSEAVAEVDQFALDECGFEEVEVTGLEYEFDGIPDELEAGTYAFVYETSGDAAELHELALFRINDGVDLSVEEILDLPEEEGLAMVTPIGGAFAAPGESDPTFLELEAGQYGAVCFIPVGTSPDAEEGGEGPPHFVEGMFAEFEVT